jgi:hypothetical protein
MDYTLPSDPHRDIPTRWMSITVYAQKTNKRPVGYLPWPEDPPPAKVKKKKKQR